MPKDAVGQTFELGIGYAVKDLSTDRGLYRAPQRIPGYRASSANRDQPNPKALPYAHIRTKHGGREVKVLVLFDEAAEG